MRNNMTIDGEVHKHDAARSLVPNQIGLLAAITFALAFTAPAMSIFFTTPAAVGVIGAQLPIVYLIAMIGVLCTGNALVQFNRRTPSSGSFITYISRSFNGRVGLVAFSVLIIGYIFAASTVIDIFGSWTHDVISRNFSIDIPWQLISVIGAVVFTVVALRGLSISTRWSVVLFAFEVVLLIAVAISIFTQGGDAGFSAKPFDLSALSTSGLGAAIVLSVYGFIGYEGAVPLGEETSNPRRNVKIATYSSIVFIGLLFLVMAYAAVIGFGVDHVDALASDSAPFDTLSRRYMGAGHIAIDIAGFTSTAACAIAVLNIQPRLIFNVARAGLIPSVFTKMHPTWRTPYAAVLLFGCFIGVLPLLFSAFGMSPLEIFGDVSTFAGLPIVIIYATVNVALIVDWVRRGRDASPFTNLVLPLVGIATWGLTIYYTVKPGQTPPFNWTWTAFVVPFVLGIALVWFTRGKDHGRLASVFAGESDAAEEAEVVAPTLG